MSQVPFQFEGGNVLSTPYTREIGGGANMVDMKGGDKKNKRSNKKTKKMKKYNKNSKKTGKQFYKNKSNRNKTSNNYTKKSKNLFTDIFEQMKKNINMK